MIPRFVAALWFLLSLAFAGRSVAAQGFEVVAGDPTVGAVQIAAVQNLVQAGLQELQATFGEPPRRSFTVHVHRRREAMPEALQRLLHTGSAGFTLLGQHRIHLVLDEARRPGAGLRGVVVHELVHELLDQWVAPHARELPRWFHEGLAQALAGDTYLGASEDDLLWRLEARRLPPFGELRHGFPMDADELQAAYAQSYSYVAWLMRGFGVHLLLQAAADADRDTTFEAALVHRTGRTTLELEDAWRTYLGTESGAPWRWWLAHWFELCTIASLPFLFLAVRRRFLRERRMAEHLAHEAALTPVEPPLADTPLSESHPAVAGEDGDQVGPPPPAGSGGGLRPANW